MSTEARASSQNENEARAALARLEADGLVFRAAENWKTSRPWQRAMARTAARLYEAGDPGADLRVPIALAMLDTYGSELDEELLAGLIEAMLPIETTSLGLSAMSAYESATANVAAG